jgi:hypothetical protein
MNDINELTKYQPYWIYKKFTELADAQNKNYFFHKLDYGMNYLLRRLLIKSSWGGVYNTMPTVNIIDNAKGKTKTPKPVPTNLLSSPGPESQVWYNVDPVFRTSNSTAIPPISTKTLNFIFPSGFNIELEIIQPTPLGDEVREIYCLMVGYLIPDSAVPMWKGAI